MIFSLYLNLPLRGKGYGTSQESLRQTSEVQVLVSFSHYFDFRHEILFHNIINARKTVLADMPDNMFDDRFSPTRSHWECSLMLEEGNKYSPFLHPGSRKFKDISTNTVPIFELTSAAARIPRTATTNNDESG
jgi:hypothetical protein